MLKENDKDGIIKFLKERMDAIRKLAKCGDYRYGYGYGHSYSSVTDEIVDICDHTLMDVSF